MGSEYKFICNVDARTEEEAKETFKYLLRTAYFKRKHPELDESILYQIQVGDPDLSELPEQFPESTRKSIRDVSNARCEEFISKIPDFVLTS